MKKTFLLLILFFIFSFRCVYATTFNMASGTQNLTCGTHTFYDSGGSGSKYSNSESYTLTVTVPAGNAITLTTVSFNTEATFDHLDIYNGATVASPSLGSFSGSTGPALTSSGNSLTFVFKSDGTTNKAGWEITITCTSLCSGTPASGTSAASPSVITCPPSSISLSASSYASGGGISYQWQSSSNGTSGWANVSGATAPSSTTSASVKTYYRLQTTCSGSGITVNSNTVVVNTSTITSVNGSTNCAAAPGIGSVGTFCGDNVTAPTSGSNWPSTTQFSCNGTIDNLIFYRFTTNALGGTVTMSVTNQACTYDWGTQVALFTPTTTCTSAGWGNSLFCASSGVADDYVFTMTSLTPNYTYWLVFDGYAGDMCTWQFKLGGNVTLPIELLSFEAIAVNNANQISWQTASEIDNDYFTVEKSTDGVSFYKLSEVKGAGTSSQAHYYNLFDPNPQPGISYYRLKQTDFNGSYKYSQIASVERAENRNVSDIYPNPTTSDINFDFYAKENGSLLIQVSDCAGRILIEEQQQIGAGKSDIRIQTHSLSEGIYYLKVTFDQTGFSSVKKIIKN